MRKKIKELSLFAVINKGKFFVGKVNCKIKKGKYKLK